MYNWKPKKNGIDQFTQYMRHQDDYFHRIKLANIRNRKNKFMFPTIPRKPHTSYQNQRSPKHMKNQLSSSLEKDYNLSKDNAYLGSKLVQISMRPKKPLNNYFIEMTEKRLKFNNAIRNLEKERLERENMFFLNRLINTQSIINHKKLEKEFNETRTATLHLKKIEPLNTIENDKDDGYKKTEGQRANTNY